MGQMSQKDFEQWKPENNVISVEFDTKPCPDAPGKDVYTLEDRQRYMQPHWKPRQIRKQVWIQPPLPQKSFTVIMGHVVPQIGRARRPTTISSTPYLSTTGQTTQVLMSCPTPSATASRKPFHPKNTKEKCTKIPTSTNQMWMHLLLPRAQD